VSYVALVFDLAGPSTSIGALVLDALLVEDTELLAQVTRYAVEDGPPVTDHITQDVERLSISGVVSAATIMGGGAGRSRLIAAKDALRLINADRLPVTITTGSDIYTSFGMTSVKIGRSGSLERITIDAEFQKIRKATMRVTAIPPERVSGDAKGKAGATAANGGKVPPASTSTTPESQFRQSQLDALINGKRTQ
jgi:hypothetical protein